MSSKTTVRRWVFLQPLKGTRYVYVDGPENEAQARKMIADGECGQYDDEDIHEFGEMTFWTTETWEEEADDDEG